MEFSNTEYIFAGIFVPVAVFIAIMACASALTRYLAAKKYSIYAIIILWVIIVVFLLNGLFSLSQGFQYPVSAALQPDASQFITIGCVEQVEIAPSPPIYFDSLSKRFSAAKFLTIDGKQYYLPYCDVKVGQTVELRWSTDERVVFAYSILPNGNNSDNITYPMPSPNTTQPRNAHEKLGQIIVVVCAGLFLAGVVLQYVTGKKLAAFFENKDQEIETAIITNRIGLLYSCVQYLLVLGILGGLVLKGFAGAGIILLIGAAVIASLIIKKYTTTAIMEEDLFVVKSLGSSHRIELGDITDVRFVASGLPHNRCLMITLKNKMVFRFEQEHYYGLGNMYKQLCSVLDQNHLTE